MAREYLTLAHESASEALRAMNNIRAERRADMRGHPTDQDQDLLRAMLVFACAGVDAAIKALIRDALPYLADANSLVQEKFDGFLTGYLSDGSVGVSPKAIAKILGSKGTPRAGAIEAYIDELTGGSLQSAEELSKVCGCLGIDDEELRQDVKATREAWVARNYIIHEMDFSPRVKRKYRRRQRKISDMVKLADGVLQVAVRIVDAVTEDIRPSEMDEAEE
ncbi:MAG: hypothetical protein WD826_01835 [Actinomycetota bacterium]